jgi:murein DD-endopeptidase MepM/ murein hydrolase activator NlpD
MNIKTLLAALILGSLALALAPPPAAEARGRYPRFLTLPFPGVHNMRIQDGWWRGDHDPHRGLDYIRGRIDDGGTWRRFPVIAAAGGRACAALNNRDGCINGVGTRVVVKHRIDGKVYFTYYGHLDTVDNAIPVGTNRYGVRVRRGQFLGWAGRTGYPGTGLHLHFQVIIPPFTSLDPYDVYGYRGAYPNPAGTNGKRCGPDRLWRRCPPKPGESNPSQWRRRGLPPVDLPAGSGAPVRLSRQRRRRGST